jgi:uncharacterized integral membrane protein
LLRKIVAAIILVPLAVVIIAFAVANRQIVTVSFDPFSAGEPAASVTLPLFALVILLLIVGVLIGGLASWLRQGKWRQTARRFERELHHLRGKVAFSGVDSERGCCRSRPGSSGGSGRRRLGRLVRDRAVGGGGRSAARAREVVRVGERGRARVAKVVNRAPRRDTRGHEATRTVFEGRQGTSPRLDGRRSDPDRCGTRRDASPDCGRMTREAPLGECCPCSPCE